MFAFMVKYSRGEKMEQGLTVIDQAVDEGLSLTRESAVQAIITQELPAGYVSERSGRGGKKFKYIKHGRVVQILNDAFGFQWSFEALPSTLRELKDGGYGIFGRLSVPIRGEIVTKIEFGTKDFMKGMNDGDLIKSAVSDALRRCAMRLGLALSLYLQDEVLTSAQVMTQLCTFAKNKAEWTADQVRIYLKSKGYTAGTLVAMQNDAYRDLAAEIGKDKMEELDTEVKTEVKTEVETEVKTEAKAEPDPLVEMAKKELGAELQSATSETGQKVNFIALYSYAEENFGFSSVETKAVLLDKLGQNWYYTDKKLIITALEEAKALG